MRTWDLNASSVGGSVLRSDFVEANVCCLRLSRESKPLLASLNTSALSKMELSLPNSARRGISPTMLRITHYYTLFAPPEGINNSVTSVKDIYMYPRESCCQFYRVLLILQAQQVYKLMHRYLFVILLDTQLLQCSQFTKVIHTEHNDISICGMYNSSCVSDVSTQ